MADQDLRSDRPDVGADDSDELLRAQVGAFRKQIPLLYAILLVNSWILASAFIADAPRWLTLAWPGVLSGICLIRMVKWWTIHRNHSEVAGRGEMLRTNVLSGFLAAAFATWSLSLYPYGTEVMRSHVAFFMAITVMSCIFCLTHLKSAAFIVAAVVNSAFVVFFLSTANPTFMAMALNVLLVTIAMLYVLAVNYRDFNALVLSRRDLQQSQSRALALGDENFKLATVDGLTGLPNRRRFFSKLNEAVDIARATGNSLVLGFLDLDGFKPVNDIHGHSTGDTLLRAIAERMREECGGAAEIYRLGGDEFGLIFSTSDVDATMPAASTLACALKLPFRLPNCTARVSGSIGLAVFPRMAANSSDLFERADYAMYRAKHGAERGAPRLFTALDEHEIRRSGLIEQTLKTANLSEELKLRFQPIVNVRTGEAVGYEALARWDSPALGQVSPGEFIPIAEKGGFVSELTTVLLKQALDDLRIWPEKLRLSFNLSVHDIASIELVQDLLAIVLMSGVDPHRIDFEITETAMASDFGAIMAAIEALKSIGAGISLDDFGSGYSSMKQVHELPLDKLKIDRSFVTGIEADASKQKIVKSILSLCEEMGFACIAEGVETTAELETIRSLGCTLVQGHIFGMPASATVLSRRSPSTSFASSVA